jgi:hypothetical protein
MLTKLCCHEQAASEARVGVQRLQDFLLLDEDMTEVATVRLSHLLLLAVSLMLLHHCVVTA